MKIKILYLIEGTGFGGGSRVFLQLATGIDKNCFEPHFACMQNGVLAEKINQAGIPFHPIVFKKLMRIQTIIDLVKLFKHLKPDIIHSQGPRVDFYCRIASCITGIKPQVSSIAMPVKGYDIGIIKKFLYSFLDLITRFCTNHYIVVSKGLAAYLHKNCRVRPDRITVIYNGIERTVYSPEAYDQRAARASLGIPADSIVVGSVGRLVYQKAFHIFIEAAALIAQQYPTVYFLLVGDGPLHEELVCLAEKLKIKNRIIFTGFRTDVPALISAMDICVLSSIQEGNPFVLLEAMAMAKPLVVTDIEGVREVVEHTISALVVEPLNSLQMAENVIALIKDPQKASMVGKEARKRIEKNFFVDRVIHQHEKLYQQLRMKI